MHSEAAQRMLMAISAASKAAAPIVERELKRAYGNGYLQRVNADRRAP